MFYDFIYVCYTWRYAMPVLIKVCLGRQGHRCHKNMNVNLYLFLFVRPKSGCCCKKLTLSGFNRYAPRFPQQETKSSTKLLAPPDPILGLENFLKTDFAQKGLPSCPSAIKPQSLIETKTLRFCNPNAKNLRK